MNPDGSVDVQVLILGITEESIELVILPTYGCWGRAALAREPEYIAVTNCLAGGLLASAGVGLAISGGK